jgi:hypothetical protein
VALVSLVYVRTQAAASRMQAEASAEQTRITRRIAALEASLRLEDRTFELRREMGDHPALLGPYLRANPQLQQVIDRAGGFQTMVMIRRMIDTTQDIHVLRRGPWRDAVGPRRRAHGVALRRGLDWHRRDNHRTGQAAHWNVQLLRSGVVALRPTRRHVQGAPALRARRWSMHWHAGVDVAAECEYFLSA